MVLPVFCGSALALYTNGSQLDPRFSSTFSPWMSKTLHKISQCEFAEKRERANSHEVNAV